MKRKNRNIKRIIGLATVGILSLNILSACNTATVETCPYSLPDYAMGEQFEIMAVGPGNGQYRYDKVYYQVADNQQTIEGYTTFKEAGFTTLLLSHGEEIGVNEVFEDSYAQQCAETAYAAGITDIYLEDLAILSNITYAPQKVVDETGAGRFLSVEELDAFITSRLEMYINEPWFSGLAFTDEPFYQQTDGIGEIYRSVKRCAAALGKADIGLFLNLNPCMVDNAAYNCYGKVGTYENLEEIYTKYLEDYIVATQCDRICVDMYPYSTKRFKEGFYPNLQKLRELCDKYDIGMSFYAQAYSEFQGGTQLSRVMGEAEVYHNLNSLIGYGVDQLVWFRYRSWPEGEPTGQWYDSAMLIDKYGNPTNVYYYTQKVLSEFQSFANVLSNYDFEGAKFYTTGGTPQYGTSNYFVTSEDTATGTVMEYDNSYEFALLKNMTINNDISLVSESYDAENDLYMYMFMNAIDPYYSQYGNTAMTIQADFGSEYEWVAEWECGVLNYVKIENGIYKKDLSAGYATYVIPLKK